MLLSTIGLSAVDYVCIVVYILAMILFGVWFSKSQKGLNEYALAGKSMHWLPLSISMYASLFSSISFLVAPAEAFHRDLQYLVALLMHPLAAVVSVILFVDFYVRMGITTVYEYTDQRFNYILSLFMLSAYTLYRALYASIVLFSVSLVLSISFQTSLAQTIVASGLIAIFYTTLGGMKAVIWSDIVQFSIVICGIAVAVYLAMKGVPGGAAEVVQICEDQGKLRLIDTQLSLTERYTLWTLIVFGFVGFMGKKGVEQMNIQRYLSARSGRSAKLALITQPLFTMSVWILLYMVGMSMYAYYSANPDPHIDDLVSQGLFDRIMPYFIVQQFPVGLKGLMVAALLGAAMSTMDSVLNVLSTISVVNIYKRVISPKSTDRQHLIVCRIMTVVWGIVVIGLSLAMMDIQSILKTVQTISGLFVSPLLGVLLLGMFTRRTNARGAFIGMLVSCAVVFCVERLTPLSFTTYGAIGLIVVLVVGYLSSLFFPAPTKRQLHNLTWKWRGLKEMLFGGPRYGSDAT